MNSKKLAILGGEKTIMSQDKQYIWPRITESVEEAVLKQLRTSISIYDASGIFDSFETNFKSIHNRKHGLLVNSGTTALHSLYFGAGLAPGDEVICPAYTFFATVTPLLSLGVVPVFCDAQEDGNIDPKRIKELITSRTKGIVVTHMWGMPCDMEAITAIANENKLLLFEDCSHAHGAMYKGKLVGTFGVGAAWSLQGQKIVTGGEGGILLTDDDDVFYRALLLGHYNKRPKQQIPKEHVLAQYAITGFGLKFRAHPLAIAIADEQLQHLNAWTIQKNRLVKKYFSALEEFGFLSLPKMEDDIVPSWYTYTFQYVPEKSNGVSIDTFVRAVIEEGLTEFDRPSSTAPIYNMPLFRNPEAAFPHLYTSAIPSKETYPGADRFYANALKIPVWAYPDEEALADLYISAITKVAKVVRDQPELLKNI